MYQKSLFLMCLQDFNLHHVWAGCATPHIQCKSKGWKMSMRMRGSRSSHAQKLAECSPSGHQWDQVVQVCQKLFSSGFNYQLAKLTMCQSWSQNTIASTRSSVGQHRSPTKPKVGTGVMEEYASSADWSHPPYALSKKRDCPSSKPESDSRILFHAILAAHNAWPSQNHNQNSWHRCCAGALSYPGLLASTWTVDCNLNLKMFRHLAVHKVAAGPEQERA
jgi:hypothetical protein